MARPPALATPPPGLAGWVLGIEQEVGRASDLQRRPRRLEPLSWAGPGLCNSCPPALSPPPDWDGPGTGPQPSARLGRPRDRTSALRQTGTAPGPALSPPPDWDGPGTGPQPSARLGRPRDRPSALRQTGTASGLSVADPSVLAVGQSRPLPSLLTRETYPLALWSTELSALQEGRA